MVKAFLVFSGLPKDSLRQVEEFLVTHEQIAWAHASTGPEVDIIAELITTTRDQANAVGDEVYSYLEEAVPGTWTQILGYTMFSDPDPVQLSTEFEAIRARFQQKSKTHSPSGLDRQRYASFRRLLVAVQDSLNYDVPLTRRIIDELQDRLANLPPVDDA